MFSTSCQVRRSSNQKALVYVGLGLSGAMWTHRKLAISYKAETPRTSENSSQPHTAGGRAHGPTGITVGWRTDAVGPDK